MNEPLTLSRILVGLSLSRFEDRSTLRFLSELVRTLEVDRVDFLHVLDAEAEDAPGGRIAEARRRMEELVASSFDKDGVKTGFQVATGPPLRRLMGAARSGKADLMVVGRKVNHHTVLPDMIARKAPCSVLVVPEGVVTTIRQILVPVDFSPHSNSSLKFAVTLATLDLDPVDYDAYYNGFANHCLWPVMHFRTDIAEFVGAANLVPVRVVELRPLGVVVETEGGTRLPAPGGGRDWRLGARGVLCLRPEALAVEEAARATGGIPGTVSSEIFEGSRRIYEVKIGGAALRVEMVTPAALGRGFKPGDEVKVQVIPETSILLPEEGPEPPG